MIIRNSFLLPLIFLLTFQSIYTIPLAQQFKQTGYAEICNTQHGAAAFDQLYAYFDEFITFLHAHPTWEQKLYSAKERFIRSKHKNYYSTDFFGFYDTSGKKEKNQISFYYSIHFHDFICLHYPEFKNIAPIMQFLNACREIQEPYEHIFSEAAAQLKLTTLFAAANGTVPILLKVVKYFPHYSATRPHYDGTAFSIFLDSTQNQSLLLSAYKSLLTVDDFLCPHREFVRTKNQNSILLIPGALLTEFSIYPTPHIVMPSSTTRYATIAFAMRPHYIFKKTELSALPHFNH